MLKKIRSLVSSYDRRFFSWLEGRVPGDESPRQTQQRIADKWTEVPSTKLASASDAQRLEKEKGYKGSRTTRLPKQHERMGRKYQEIPDPWD